MTEDRPFNGHTALLMRVAAVLVPLSLLVSAGAAFGGWVNSQDVRRQNDRLERVVDDLEAERQDREQATCEGTLEARAEQRDMWVRVLQRAGVDEPTIDILRDGYADLPTPASCT